MDSLLWASYCYNPFATSANDGWLSPHERSVLWEPPALVVATGFGIGPPSAHLRKPEYKARLCHFLNFGYNHRRDCFKLLDADAGKVIYSCDITRYHPKAPLIPPINADRCQPTALQEDIYVPAPAPGPDPGPAPAPAPAPTPATLPTPAPAPKPVSQLGYHHLHGRLNPWLRSSHALDANYTIRNMRRPGGHVTKPVQ